MTTIGFIILITTIIQEYVCWMTYKNWFDNEIKHMKMIGSDSFIAMVINFICMDSFKFQ
jgi:hypothetical protein